MDNPSLKLPSSRPEFKGFAEYYEDEIKPFLRSNENLRKRSVKKAAFFGSVFAAIGGFIQFFVPHNADMIPMLVGSLGGAGTGGWILNKAKARITEGLLGRITDKLNFSYEMKLERPDYFEIFHQLKFFNAFNREHWEDEVKGSYNGQDFTLCECHLKYKTRGKNSSTRTVFHGQLIVIDYPKEFSGTTVIHRDSGIANRFKKPGKEFSKVGLASGEFEKNFEVWSTDQVEARTLLDPIMMERFQELQRLYNGKGVQAAFVHDKMILALATGDRLNMGSMFKPLEGHERVETILKEFDIIFDMMDVSFKQVDGKMDGAFSIDQVKADG